MVLLLYIIKINAFISFCTISMLFLLIFLIPNVGTSWLNYMLPGSSLFCIPLLLLVKEEYKREHLDKKIWCILYIDNYGYWRLVSEKCINILRPQHSLILSIAIVKMFTKANSMKTWSWVLTNVANVWISNIGLLSIWQG